MQHIYFGILAGGTGERLWPISTKEQPKQLVPFVHGKSLLQHTIERIAPIANKENIFVITNAQQEELVRQNTGNSIGFMIVEPEKRNTGPAILLASQTIYHKDPEAIVIFLTADHFIPKPENFLNSLKHAIEYTQKNKKIALFGLMPTFPATAYGYIQIETSEQKVIINQPYTIKKFHEKPHKEHAKKYMTQSDMFWNMGVFVGKASAFIEEFETCTPDITRAMHEYLFKAITYDQIPAGSIDYTVMERSKNITLFPVDFEWYDIGNLQVFLHVQAKYGAPQTDILSIESHTNLIRSNKKLVACIGVSNLCIVETDDVLIISRNDKVDYVKTVLNKYKEKNKQENSL